LLLHRPLPQVALRFEECFGEQAQKRIEEPTKKAREMAQVGRFQAALAKYREALSRQPFSWVLMNEVAHFLTFALRDAKAGLEMSRTALRLNPACSADLWNMLGDCLFYLKRVDDGRLAFERALAINREDVRARFNLAFVHVEAKEYAQALARLAEGLALDRTGVYRDRLLQKQTEVLALLDLQNQRRYLGQANRVTGPCLGPGPVSITELPVPTRSERHPEQTTSSPEGHR
jgi:tetratricopeptide (TPR) repeat protein